MAAIAPSETCTVQMSADLYNDIREFLSDSGKTTTGEINQFVDAAVSNYLLRKATERVHFSTAHLSEQDLADSTRESVEWARAQK